MLPFPNRDGVLDFLDQPLGGIEGLLAVRRRNNGVEGDVADLQFPDPMRCADPQARLGGESFAELSEQELGVRMRLVVERTDTATLIVIPDDPREDHQGSTGRGENGPIESGLIDGFGSDERRNGGGATGNECGQFNQLLRVESR